MHPILRALAQFDDPRFVGVVVRSVAWSALTFVALLVASVWGVHHLVQGWLGWLGAAFSGVLAGLLALWLFVPFALVIASLYVERVAAAVERRYYPGLPPPSGANLAVQAWDGVVLGLQLLVLNLAVLVTAPFHAGLGLVLGWLVGGWAIGRGLFVAVAMLRMGRGEALALYARRRIAVVVPGVILALAASVPLLNLLVPVIAMAAMTHVLHETRRRSV
jgi:CysZ protein